MNNLKRYIFGMLSEAEVLRTRLDRLKFASSSLKRLTQLCILHNKKFFCKQTHYLPDPFHRISNAMKKELIELAAKIHGDSIDEDSEEEIDLQCQMLQLLLNKDIVSFEFPPAIKTDCKSVTDLCESLVSIKPTNLQSIVRECRESWNLRPFFNQLVQFSNLQTIKLENFKCENQDLCTIATHFNNLRVLEVDLDDSVSEEGISALAKLPNLRIFFFNGNSLETLSILLSLCLHHLPHLHELGHIFNPRVHPLQTDNEQSPLGCNCTSLLGLPMAKALYNLKKPCQIGLQKLHLTFLAEIPQTFSLPNLRAFYVVEPRTAVQVDDRFSKVSELGLYGIPSRAECFSILGRLGHQLNKLYLLVRGYLDVSKVLDVCPNLNEMHLYASEFVSSADLKPETLSTLRDLKICLEETTENRIQSGLMLQLMEAPKLRSVEVQSDEGVALSPEDILDIVHAVKTRKILRRLQSFLLVGNLEDLELATFVFHQSAHFGLIMNCPRLHSVSAWVLNPEAENMNN